MVTGRNLRYLCAVLNSNLVTWLASRIAVTTGMGLTQWDKFTVERIPVVQPVASTLASFDDAVVELLAMIEVGNIDGARDLDHTINRMVFDLYGLSSREIGALIGIDT